uniref:Uncharacterized protein n=1 Tax=Chromera velia CCMP2878 TaxID=1169474 RepID=A0A0G4HLE4_9ALVE|eukprot:Cvel_28772.t1-p1 / transcript=Cvel_28772.t1 / gene=Cvel_28772 / organism=Chromera_velia_CCMP2878 / gene_product=hypothetical protein / transcript_product=hypothetical protein / location=Cvel_scaffold3829:5468-6320(-) / protein_length=169 / sequence_SO=supercontig / SO=protein_coding / is_pseudo=false
MHPQPSPHAANTYGFAPSQYATTQPVFGTQPQQLQTQPIYGYSGFQTAAQLGSYSSPLFYGTPPVDFPAASSLGPPSSFPFRDPDDPYGHVDPEEIQLQEEYAALKNGVKGGEAGIRDLKRAYFRLAEREELREMDKIDRAPLNQEHQQIQAVVRQRHVMKTKPCLCCC